MIKRAQIEQAKERLILERATHLDSLVARLGEPRVLRVLQPILAGQMHRVDLTFNDDVSYVQDLGLVRRTNPLQIANPIYREVIARVLSAGLQHTILLPERSFVRRNGRLSMRRILREFADFWREHAEILTSAMEYHEVAPQLVLMAYLQRVVNGGGFVDREYGLGRDRIDVLIRWPLGNRRWQREVIELKVWRAKQKDPLDKGLEQLGGYLDGLGLKHGALVIFDRRPEARPLEKRVKQSQVVTKAGHRVSLLRA